MSQHTNDNLTLFDRLFDPDIFVNLTDEEILLLALIEAEDLPEVVFDEEKTDEDRMLEERILAGLREQIAKEAIDVST